MTNITCLSEAEIRKIIKAVSTAVKDDVNELYADKGYVTNNAMGNLKWDCINTNLCDTLDKEKFEVKILDRRIWKLVLIYNKQNRELYSLMRKPNYYTVKDNRAKRKNPHYLDSLVVINPEICEESEQMSLFKTQPELTQDKINDLLQEILKLFSGTVSKYFLFLFVEENMEIVKFEAYQLDKMLNRYDMADYSELIELDFDDRIELSAKGYGGGIDADEASVALVKIKEKERKEERNG